MGSKPPKEKAAKVPVFGTELAKLLSDTGDEGTQLTAAPERISQLIFPVPQVVRICTQFIEEHGVINGIYRASGISSNIQRIKWVSVMLTFHTMNQRQDLDNDLQLLHGDGTDFGNLPTSLDCPRKEFISPV